MTPATPFDKFNEIPQLVEVILNALLEDIILIYDREGYINHVWLGSNIEKRYKTNEDEFLGKNLRDLFPEDVAESRIRKLDEIFETGEQYREEYKIERSNKTYWHDIVLSPIKEEGQVAAVIGYIRDITHLKKTEEALNKVDKGYKSLIENIPIGVFRTTPDGKILFANKCFLDITGFESYEVLNAANLEAENHYFEGFTRKEFREIMEKEGSISGLESIWKRSDGTTIHIRENASVVKDEDGNVLYYEGTIEDIGDRKKMEENLRESEEKYRNLVERSYNGVCLVQNGNLTYVNPRLAEIIGYAVDEILDTDFVRYIAPDEREFVYENYRKRMKGEYVAPVYETKLLDKSGNLVDVELNAGIIQIRGEPADFVFVKDITEQKRVERELIESERKYRVLFESSSEAILLLTPDCGVLDADQKACDIFGYSKGELLNKKLEDLMSSNTYDNVESHFDEFLRRDYSTEGYVVTADDGKLPVEFTLKKVKLGGEDRLLAIFHDISRRFNLQKQLRRSQRLEAVGQLAGGIAHDFNNILTALFGYTDILKYALEGNDDLQGYVDEIEKVASKASALTQQLLTFSRKQILEPIVIDLNVVVEEMTGMLSRLIGEKIEFRQNLDDDLPLILADRGGVEQIIMNLVVNARDAMVEGGQLRIETRKEHLDDLAVSTQPGVEAGDFVVLSVSDTGHGIPRAIRDRIFDPFFTTKSELGGTGLGLPTVFSIVKQSGGFLDLVTEEGRGTRIEIYFPAVEGEVDIESKTCETGIKPGNESILVVEDDPAVRKTIMTILKGAGYQAQEASNGAEAIKIVALSTEVFDLVITDIVMPHIDGRELADKLQEVIPELRILYISGYENSSNFPTMNLNKRMGFLKKPFTAALLTRKVRELLDA